MLSSRVIHSNQNSINKTVKPIYYGLLLLGIVLRLIPYFINRSLFWDEASIALNVIDRHFAGLFQPLDYQQVAPILFLFIEKVNTILLGKSEQSLRLFAMVCGILNLPLVYRLTKEISGNTVAALIALFLFATSPVLIEYSNMVKQYEGDVLCALCLLNLVFSKSLSANENRRYMLLAGVGIISIFLSNVAVLVMFSIGVYYLLKYRWGIFKMWQLLLVFGCWVITFLVYYWFFIRNNPLRGFMIWWWKDYFMPVQIFSAAFWAWLYIKFLSVFKFYSLPFLAVYLLSILIFSIRKQRLLLFFLLFPLAVHFILSGFKLYPFEVRLFLYVIAFITPALAIGIVELAQIAMITRITKYVAAILLMVLVYSIIAQLVNTHYPFPQEEVKSSINFINTNRSPGQKVYVYFTAKRAVNYYERINRVSFKNDLIWEKDDWWGYSHDLAYDTVTKTGGEVWLLYSTVYNNDDVYTLNRFKESNDTILKRFNTVGSSAYLVKINTK